MKTIYLISCSSRKRSQACPAADLYISPLFLKARAMAKKAKAPWYILSAKHGLLKPTQVVKPYNITLNTMSLAKRREWGKGVIRQMDDQLPEADEVVFLAGAK